MSFGTGTAWSRPKSRKQRVASTKWVDLQPRDRTKPRAMNRVGKKGEWWMFINQILEQFFERIELLRVCEIQGDFCDGYHVAKAHSRRRQDIDWEIITTLLGSAGQGMRDFGWSSRGKILDQ